MIDSFTEENRFLSNFVNVPIVFEGETYNSVEHAYVAAKTFDQSIRKEIQLCPTAGRVKRLGREIEIRHDWEEVKLGMMTNFVRQKFNQEPFRTLLINTGQKTLIEGNNWHDNFWGVCSCETCKDRAGRNMLGTLLMQVREELKQPSLYY